LLLPRVSAQCPNIVMFWVLLFQMKSTTIIDRHWLSFKKGRRNARLRPKSSNSCYMLSSGELPGGCPRNRNRNLQEGRLVMYSLPLSILGCLPQ